MITNGHIFLPCLARDSITWHCMSIASTPVSEALVYFALYCYSLILIMMCVSPSCIYIVPSLVCTYSETSLIRHSMGPENNVGLGGCWIMECLLPYLCMVTVPHIMVGLERMLDYRGVGLGRFHCMWLTYMDGYSGTTYFHTVHQCTPWDTHKCRY